MAEIYDYNTTASNNNSSPPDGFPENMQYSQVNNAAREVMAVIARYIQALGGVTTTGSGSAYILTLDQKGAPSLGRHYIFTAHATNTAGATLSINGGPALAISRRDNAAVPAGALAASGTYFIAYNGTSYVLLGNPTGAEIKAAYETQSMAFTDALYTKLVGIDAAKLAGIDDASETSAGLVERATLAEVQAGTDTMRYITPANLSATTPAFVIRETTRAINGAGSGSGAARDPALSGVSLQPGSYAIEGFFPIDAPTSSGNFENFGIGVRFIGTPALPFVNISWVVTSNGGHARSGRLELSAGSTVVTNATVSTRHRSAVVYLAGFIRLTAVTNMDFAWTQTIATTSVRAGAFIRYTRKPS